jgi:uncharacterized protein YjiS (DUF1127 family)
MSRPQSRRETEVPIEVLSHPVFFTGSLRRASLARFLAQLPAEIEERNDIAARYAALIRLSDNELAGIGIGRDDVPRVAVLGSDA